MPIDVEEEDNKSTQLAGRFSRLFHEGFKGMLYHVLLYGSFPKFVAIIVHL